MKGYGNHLAPFGRCRICHAPVMWGWACWECVRLAVIAAAVTEGVHALVECIKQRF